MPDKRRWKDILWAVQAPPDVCGWMDWATGILYLNEEIDDPTQWKTFLASQRTDPERELLLTITHENVHFLQMATTGYMYRWGCQLYDHLVAAMQPRLPEITKYLDDPDPRTLQGLESQMGAADRVNIQAHLAALDRAGGPNNVTVRDLLESHAWLVEKKTHWQGLDAAGYLHMLNERSPGPEYRHAYDLARFRLGDGAAFAFFPLIVALSLCANDPPQAFDVLVAELGKSSWPQCPSRNDFEKIQQIAIDNLPDRLGSSGEVMESNALTHPVYTAAAQAINDACGQGFKLLDFFIDPIGHLEHIVMDVIQPMVFRANGKDQYAIWFPPRLDQTKVTVLLLYSVLASRVLGQHSAPDGSASRAAWSWLSEVQPDLALISIEPPQLNRGDLGALAQLSPVNLPERKKFCHLWGRYLLTFNLKGDTPLYTRPEVRRYLARLEQTNPAFPIYLCMVPDFGMFVLWFGSLAPPEAWHEGSLNAMHPNVLDHLIRSLKAIQRMMDQCSVQSRPVLQALLVPYPREIAEKLLREVSAPNVE